MKRILLLITSICVTACVSDAATIALWTFESPNTPPTVTGNSIAGLLPSVGNGSAMGFHANASTMFSASIGNGSTNSLSADHWTVGDYWQFHVSTVGFSGLQLNFAQRAAATGPTNFNLAFSLDGTAFTTALSHYGVRGNGGLWSNNVPNVNTIMSVNLSAFTQLDNASDVYFRLTTNIGLPATTSTGSIDDFQVTANVIPEPANLLLPALATLVLFGRRHRRQR